MSRHKTKLPANSANRQSPSRKGMLRSPYFAWLASVLAIELIFALSIPDTILTELPALGRWTKFVAGFFPAVGNFNAIARHPEAVAFFLSIAPLFMLPKVYIAYRWLNSDYLGTYRHLVISPLTMHQPAGREFFTGDAAKTKPRSAETGKTRSPFARFAGSLIVMAFCILGACMLAVWGREVNRGGSSLGSLQVAYTHFAQGGFWMWFEWSYRSMVVALLVAIGLCIVRDYFRWAAARTAALIQGSKDE